MVVHCKGWTSVMLSFHLLLRTVSKRQYTAYNTRLGIGAHSIAAIELRLAHQRRNITSTSRRSEERETEPTEVQATTKVVVESTLASTTRFESTRTSVFASDKYLHAQHTSVPTTHSKSRRYRAKTQAQAHRNMAPPTMSIFFLGTSSGGGPSESRNCSSLLVDALGNGDLWSEYLPSVLS
jgi:hypothetical protein